MTQAGSVLRDGGVGAHVLGLSCSGRWTGLSAAPLPVSPAGFLSLPEH